MLEHEKKAAAILDKFEPDHAAAAAYVYKTRDRDLILFILQVGFEVLAGRRRATQRKVMRATVIRPGFVSGNTRGPKVTLSVKSRRKLAEATITLFQSWKVGNLPLGKATKARLLSEADAETASGAGHYNNANFYKTLAAPMADDETVADHWKDEEAIKLIRDEIWNEKDPSPSKPPKDA